MNERYKVIITLLTYFVSVHFLSSGYAETHQPREDRKLCLGVASSLCEEGFLEREGLSETAIQLVGLLEMLHNGNNGTTVYYLPSIPGLGTPMLSRENGEPVLHLLREADRTIDREIISQVDGMPKREAVEAEVHVVEMATITLHAEKDEGTIPFGEDAALAVAVLQYPDDGISCYHPALREKMERDAKVEQELLERRVRLQELVPQCVTTRLRTSQWPLKRVMAAIELGETGNASSLGPLLMAARSNDPNLVYSAIWAMGKIGNPTAIPVLKKLSSSHPDEEVQNLARYTATCLAWQGSLPYRMAENVHNEEQQRKAALERAHELKLLDPSLREVKERLDATRQPYTTDDFLAYVSQREIAAMLDAGMQRLARRIELASCAPGRERIPADTFLNMNPESQMRIYRAQFADIITSVSLGYDPSTAGGQILLPPWVTGFEFVTPPINDWDLSDASLQSVRARAHQLHTAQEEQPGHWEVFLAMAQIRGGGAAVLRTTRDTSTVTEHPNSRYVQHMHVEDLKAIASIASETGLREGHGIPSDFLSELQEVLAEKRPATRRTIDFEKYRRHAIAVTRLQEEHPRVNYLWNEAERAGQPITFAQLKAAMNYQTHDELRMFFKKRSARDIFSTGTPSATIKFSRERYERLVTHFNNTPYSFISLGSLLAPDTDTAQPVLLNDLIRHALAGTLTWGYLENNVLLNDAVIRRAQAAGIKADELTANTSSKLCMARQTALRLGEPIPPGTLITLTALTSLFDGEDPRHFVADENIGLSRAELVRFRENQIGGPGLHLTGPRLQTFHEEGKKGKLTARMILELFLEEARIRGKISADETPEIPDIGPHFGFHYASPILKILESVTLRESEEIPLDVVLEISQIDWAAIQADEQQQYENPLITDIGYEALRVDPSHETAQALESLNYLIAQAKQVQEAGTEASPVTLGMVKSALPAWAHPALRQLIMGSPDRILDAPRTERTLNDTPFSIVGIGSLLPLEEVKALRDEARAGILTVERLHKHIEHWKRAYPEGQDLFDAYFDRFINHHLCQEYQIYADEREAGIDDVVITLELLDTALQEGQHLTGPRLKKFLELKRTQKLTIRRLIELYKQEPYFNPARTEQEFRKVLVDLGATGAMIDFEGKIKDIKDLWRVIYTILDEYGGIPNSNAPGEASKTAIVRILSRDEITPEAREEILAGNDPAEAAGKRLAQLYRTIADVNIFGEMTKVTGYQGYQSQSTVPFLTRLIVPQFPGCEAGLRILQEVHAEYEALLAEQFKRACEPGGQLYEHIQAGRLTPADLERIRQGALQIQVIPLNEDVTSYLSDDAVSQEYAVWWEERFGRPLKSTKVFKAMSDPERANGTLGKHLYHTRAYCNAALTQSAVTSVATALEQALERTPGLRLSARERAEIAADIARQVVMRKVSDKNVWGGGGPPTERGGINPLRDDPESIARYESPALRGRTEILPAAFGSTTFQGHSHDVTKAALEKFLKACSLLPYAQRSQERAAEMMVQRSPKKAADMVRNALTIMAAGQEAYQRMLYEFQLADIMKKFADLLTAQRGRLTADKKPSKEAETYTRRMEDQMGDLVRGDFTAYMYGHYTKIVIDGIATGYKVLQELGLETDYPEETTEITVPAPVLDHFAIPYERERLVQYVSQYGIRAQLDETDAITGLTGRPDSFLRAGSATKAALEEHLDFLKREKGKRKIRPSSTRITIPEMTLEDSGVRYAILSYDAGGYYYVKDRTRVPVADEDVEPFGAAFYLKGDPVLEAYKSHGITPEVYPSRTATSEKGGIVTGFSGTVNQFEAADREIAARYERAVALAPAATTALTVAYSTLAHITALNEEIIAAAQKTNEAMTENRLVPAQRAIKTTFSLSMMFPPILAVGDALNTLTKLVRAEVFALAPPDAMTSPSDESIVSLEQKAQAWGIAPDDYPVLFEHMRETGLVLDGILQPDQEQFADLPPATQMNIVHYINTIDDMTLLHPLLRRALTFAPTLRDIEEQGRFIETDPAIVRKHLFIMYTPERITITNDMEDNLRRKAEEWGIREDDYPQLFVRMREQGMVMETVRVRGETISLLPELDKKRFAQLRPVQQRQIVHYVLAVNTMTQTYTQSVEQLKRFFGKSFARPPWDTPEAHLYRTEIRRLFRNPPFIRYIRGSIQQGVFDLLAPEEYFVITAAIDTVIEARGWLGNQYADDDVNTIMNALEAAAKKDHIGIDERDVKRARDIFASMARHHQGDYFVKEGEPGKVTIFVPEEYRELLRIIQKVRTDDEQGEFTEALDRIHDEFEGLLHDLVHLVWKRIDDEQKQSLEQEILATLHRVNPGFEDSFRSLYGLADASQTDVVEEIIAKYASGELARKFDDEVAQHIQTTLDQALLNVIYFTVGAELINLEVQEQRVRTLADLFSPGTLDASTRIEQLYPVFEALKIPVAVAIHPSLVAPAPAHDPALFHQAL